MFECFECQVDVSGWVQFYLFSHDSNLYVASSTWEKKIKMPIPLHRSKIYYFWLTSSATPIFIVRPFQWIFLRLFISTDDHAWGMLVVSGSKLVWLSTIFQLSSQTCCSKVPVWMKRKFGFIMKISELHDHASFLTRSFLLGPDSIDKGMIFETKKRERSWNISANNISHITLNR